MAAIDDRAAALNRRLSRTEEPEPAPEESEEPDGTEDQGAGGADAEDGQDQDDEDQEGAEPAQAPAPDAGSGTVAGILLGLAIYSIVIQYVRGGSAQVRGWLKAKAINAPMPATTATTPSNAPKGASL